MNVEPKIEFVPEPALDYDPEVNPATDYLIECPRCGEVRHKSWFKVHWPACAACMQFDRLFLENLNYELATIDPLQIVPQVMGSGSFLSEADIKLRPLSEHHQRPRRRRR